MLTIASRLSSSWAVFLLSRFSLSLSTLWIATLSTFQELLVEIPVILVERGDHDGQVGQSTRNVEES